MPNSLLDVKIRELTDSQEERIYRISEQYKCQSPKGQISLAKGGSLYSISNSKDTLILTRRTSVEETTLFNILGYP